MKKIKKYGAFGGLFDPPHVGHLIIAQSVLEEFHLDKVIFIPAGKPPHKSRYSPYMVRFRMTELAIKTNRNFTISNIEHIMMGKTYTIEVIKELKKKLRGMLYFIIGSDQWLEIRTWKDPQELLSLCKVIVVPRPHYDITKVHDGSKRILLSHSPLIDISSTQIRKRIKNNLDVRHLVPQAVYTFIRRKKLYK